MNDIFRLRAALLSLAAPLSIFALFGCSAGDRPVPFELDYSEVIHLDAEDLAETGIAEAYEALLPKLRMYVPEPAKIQEDIDNDAPRYSVRCGAMTYTIYEPKFDEGDSWGRATYAFFAIVNAQLSNSPYRFYALYGGNDLGGMFLTPAQAEAARHALPNKSDWPYIPNDESPWFGEYH
jgi:hypothetical protein